MMRLVLSVLALCAILSAPLTASAKVIGIVADDSGSMGSRVHLPGFGVQLLAATVNGAKKQDRLFTLTLNGYARHYGNLQPINADTMGQIVAQRGKAWREENLRVGRTKRGTIDRLGNLFKGGGGTPYGAVEAMLWALAEEAGDGEDAYLIVLTDGAFGGLGTPDELRASYLKHRERMKRKRGNLRVEFLYMMPGDPAAAQQQDGNIEKQGVRPGLLEVFNGTRTEGKWNVNSGDAMWDALKNIIANVAQTDVSSVSKYVKHAGDTVTIDSPFSISRIVAVSAAPTSAPLPEYQSGLSQGVDPDAIYTARMTQGDDDFDRLTMHGRVQQFRFTTGLAPGQYALKFSASVENSVFLLFEIQSTAVLRIEDDQGNEAPRDGSGQYVLIKGKPYKFITQLLDPKSPGGVVDFNQIPTQTVFRVQRTGPSGQPQTDSMSPDTPANRAVNDYTPDRTGDFWATTQVRIPGFATPESERVNYRVLDSGVELNVGPFTPFETCPACGTDEVQSSITPGGPDTEIGSFTVTPQSDLTGTIRFEKGDFPDFTYLTDQAGIPVPFDQDIAVPTGQTQTYRLMRKGELQGGEIAGSPAPVSITITPTGGWAGDPVEISRKIILKAPPLIMTLVSHATDAAAQGPLELSATELWRGNLDGMFSFQDLVSTLEQDRAGDDFTVTYDGLLGPLLSYDIIVSAPGSVNDTAQIKPRTSYWCLCLFGIGNWITGSEDRVATLHFTDRWDLQKASADIPMRFTIAGRPFLFSCILDIILLFLFILFIRGLIAILQTRRFPRNSVAEIREGKGNRVMPRYEDLRGWNWTWIRCWFALFVGPPHERTTVEGLEIRASRAGPVLLINDEAPPWTSEYYGQPIADVMTPNAKTHQLSWDEVLSSQVTRNLTVQFKRDMND